MATQMYNTLFNHPFFATRFNIPENFGRALGYEAQIHCLLDLLDEMAGAAWVSPDELDNAYDELQKMIEDLDAKVERYYQDLGNRITQLDQKVENYYKTLGDKIDKLDQKVEQYHAELGDTINQFKNQYDADLTEIRNRLTSVENKNATQDQNITNLTNSRDNTISNIYGATLNPDGTISFPAGTKIPVSALNIWAYNSSPTSADYANALRSRDLSNYDIKGA